MSQSEYLIKAVSGYFVNFYFNTLYKVAKNASVNSREGLSITDTYRAKVASFIQAIKHTEDGYKMLVTRLHEYCVNVSSRFTSLSSSRFINTLVEGFVPIDYKDSLSTTDRDEIFSIVILDLAGTLGSFCTKPDTLRKIIDQHDSAKSITCESIYSESMRCLENKRDVMINRFVREIAQAKDYVSSEAANKLRLKLDQKEEEINELKEYISTLQHQVSDLQEKEAKLRRMVELLQKNKIVIQQDSKPKPEPTPLTKDNLSKYNREPVTPVSKSIPRLPTPPPEVEAEADDEREAEEEEEVESNSDSGSLSSGKNSVINNIDEVIFNREDDK